jgi:hypothetical protein
MMIEADDAVVADYATRLWRRNLPKCVRRFFVEAWNQSKIDGIDEYLSADNVHYSITSKI